MRHRCLAWIATTLVFVVPVVARAEPPAADTVAISLQKRPTGTFYIPAALEGHGELDLLVDTGSSFLVINETMLGNLKARGLADFSHELNGAMADGSRRVIPVYRLAGLRLGENCWIRDVEAAIFPGNARPILGMNVLGRLAPFTFSAEPPQLALARCQAAPSPALAASDAAAVEPDAAPTDKSGQISQ